MIAPSSQPDVEVRAPHEGASREILTRLGAMTLVDQADHIASTGAAASPVVAEGEEIAPPVA